MLIDLESKILDFNNIFAHRVEKDDLDKKELLIEHLYRCFNIYIKLSNNKTFKFKESINSSFKDLKITRGNLVFELSKESLELILDMFDNAIYLHDIGKINLKYQNEKMKNDIYKKYNVRLNSMNTTHSKISTYFYLNMLIPLINSIKNKQEHLFLKYILLSIANIIYCHHGSIQNLEDNFDVRGLKDLISFIESGEYLVLNKDKNINFNENLGQTIAKIEKNYKFDYHQIYVCLQCFRSLLICADFISTNEFIRCVNNKEDFNLGRIENINILDRCYKSSSIYKESKKYKKHINNKKTSINDLRCHIFQSCEKNLKKHINDSNFFNLSAPTGGGKTYTSIYCSLLLMKKFNLNRLIYVSPMNNLIEQNESIFKNLFKEDVNIQTINSIAPISVNNLDYSKILLERQMWAYNIVSTTNVSLFDVFFGTSKESIMPLIQVSNSVIILDEIQNYKNLIWREIIELLYKYSKFLNIKFIIMSATCPNLQSLIGFKTEQFIDLLPNSKEMSKNELFTNRTIYDFSLYDKTVNNEILFIEAINAIIDRNIKEKLSNRYNKSKIILEFISKKRAKDVYIYFKNKLNKKEYELLWLDSDDNYMKRNEVIETLKKTNLKKDVILIATQVIEAGLDIDADIGFKDTVFLDTEEQFAGRINRSGRKHNCKIFFFNLDDEYKIYKKDFRLGLNVGNLKYRQYFFMKNYEKFYEDVFLKIQYFKDTSFNKSINEFYDLLKLQKFKQIEKHMNLIDKNTIQIFIPVKEIKIKTSENTYVIINGNDVWKEYEYIINQANLNYSERRIRLMNTKKIMSLFIFNVYGNGIEEITPVGGIFKIPDGEKYILDGKLQDDLLRRVFTIK